MDVDAVLLSVQERDKWRRRLNLLEHSLDELRHNRAHLELRLRNVRKEIINLARYSDALLDETVRKPLARTIHAAEGNTPRR